MDGKRTSDRELLQRIVGARVTLRNAKDRLVDERAVEDHGRVYRAAGRGSQGGGMRGALGANAAGFSAGDFAVRGVSRAQI